MQRKETFLKNNKNKGESFTKSSEETSGLDPTHFSLNDSTITISMDNKEETPSNDEKKESITKYKDTNNNRTIKNIYKTKKIAFIKRKRVHSAKLKKIKNEKKCHFSYPPNSELKKSKKDQNTSTFSELDKCYNILNDLISQYSSTEISDIIIKDSNNTNIGLSILPSRFSFNNQIKKISKEYKEKKEIKDKKEASNNNEIQLIDENDDIKDIFESKSDDENKVNEEKEIKNEKNQYGKIINGLRKMKQKEYCFGNHYYNDKNNIYCYHSRTIKSTKYTTTYCMRRRKGCNAKCMIFANSDSFQLIGAHSQNCSISQNEFYQKFPELKNKKWSHIQIVKKKNDSYVLVVQK